uniref:Uncharacterized protein n=1 Tax=Arundo donax TaxID=35708 RepID=A0A0A9CJY2_ARUDO
MIKFTIKSSPIATVWVILVKKPTVAHKNHLFAVLQPQAIYFI